MTKWGDRPHWEMDAVYLGADDAGDWIGFPTGTHMSRPGRVGHHQNDQVGLVPAAGTPWATPGSRRSTGRAGSCGPTST